MQHNDDVLKRAEAAALEVWLTGSADTTQMMLSAAQAVRVAREQIAKDIERLCIDPEWGDEQAGLTELGRFAAEVARGKAA